MDTDTIDTELVLLVNNIDMLLDQLRRAVREGAMFVAADTVDLLRDEVHALVDAFPEED